VDASCRGSELTEKKADRLPWEPDRVLIPFKKNMVEGRGGGDSNPLMRDFDLHKSRDEERRGGGANVAAR